MKDYYAGARECHLHAPVGAIGDSVKTHSALGAGESPVGRIVAIDAVGDIRGRHADDPRTIGEIVAIGAVGDVGNRIGEDFRAVREVVTVGAVGAIDRIVMIGAIGTIEAVI